MYLFIHKNFKKSFKQNKMKGIIYKLSKVSIFNKKWHNQEN